MRKLAKLLSLPLAEQRAFFYSLWLLIYYRTFLKVRNTRSLIQETVDASVNSTCNSNENIELKRIVSLFKTASRIVPYATCLSKTLAGKKLLAHYGYSTEVHIGVTKDDRKAFGAHAWLTHQGHVVLCDLPNLDKYKELPLNKLQGMRLEGLG